MHPARSSLILDSISGWRYNRFCKSATEYSRRAGVGKEHPVLLYFLTEDGLRIIRNVSK